MPVWGPISRANLIRGLRALGYEGPFQGGRHSYMVRGGRRLAIPNQHPGAIGISLLARILRQAGVTREESEAI